MRSRTTIHLDHDLMAELKKRGKRDDVSLTQIVNEANRQWLQGPSKPQEPKRFIQKTRNMGLPLIDLTHTNAVLDELDVEDFCRRMVMGE